MTNFFPALFFIALSFFLLGCSTPKGAYKEEKNPIYSTSRSFVENPEELKRAARATLEERIAESDPPVSTKLKGSDDTFSTGWVYGTSRDKYVEFNFNGAPQRKKLAVRRKYTYQISPALSGSQVTVDLEEEIQKVDLNTGKPNGWDSVTPDAQEYDAMIKRLREKVRAL